MFKLGRKTIALVMAAAVALSGAAVSNYGAVKAAEAEPTVKVLGATLAADNDKGFQSLRVGIEVSNASYASECGIKLKLKDSSKDYTVVSTADENYQKVYSKNVDEDKIVYTVVVKNIPVAQAAAEIEFIGFVKKTEAPEVISAQTDAVTKSINGIVESIGAQTGKDVIMLESGDYAGTLVYEYAKLDMSAEHTNLEMPDKSGDYSSGKFVVGKNNARAVCEYVAEGEEAPYYKVTTPEAGEGTENTQGKGIGYIHPSMATTDSYIYSADIKSEAGTDINLCAFYGWNTWPQAGFEGKILAGNGQWQKFEVKTSNQESYDGSSYFSTANAGNKEYCIKNFVIYKVLTDADMPEIAAPVTGWNADKTEYSLKLDDSSVLPNDKCTVVKNDNGSYTISAAEGCEVGFAFPEEVWKNNDFRTMTITYKNASGFTGVGIAKKYGTSSPWWSSTYPDDASWGGGALPDGAGEKIFNIDAGKVVDEKYFSAFRFFSVPAEATVTIESIVLSGLEKHEAVEPTATPSPDDFTTEELALSADICTNDGDSASAVVEDGVLKLNLAQYQGVIINIPEAVYTSGYDYADVTFSNPGGADVNLYLLNEEMTDGKGQTPAGQQDPISIKSNTDETTVTYQLQSGSYIKGLKYVSFAGSPIVQIKSIVLKKNK